MDGEIRSGIQQNCGRMLLYLQSGYVGLLGAEHGRSFLELDRLFNPFFVRVSGFDLATCRGLAAGLGEII